VQSSQSHQVLARKWRPRDFESLVGQDTVVRALRHALDNDRLHHAYLLTGTRGVGKTTIARILAKGLNCETGVTSRPCGRCDACVGVDQGRFPDYVEMDAASNRKVEEMTVVLENAAYSPSIGRYKVFVIDEVHMLSNHAFNAMLKTLEEPPDHVVFVLATTDPQKVPVTVLSRCMQFGLRNMTPAAVSARLAYVLQEEKVPFDAPALELIARAAAGSMRDALSLLDQAIALGGGSVSLESVRDMLGAVDGQMVAQLLQLLAAGTPLEVISLGDEMAATNVLFTQLLMALARELQRVALAQLDPGVGGGYACRWRRRRLGCSPRSCDFPGRCSGLVPGGDPCGTRSAACARPADRVHDGAGQDARVQVFGGADRGPHRRWRRGPTAVSARHCRAGHGGRSAAALGSARGRAASETR
jgi:DNA polymerase-3 subunit gamma/tau